MNEGLVNYNVSTTGYCTNCFDAVSQTLIANIEKKETSIPYWYTQGRPTDDYLHCLLFTGVIKCRKWLSVWENVSGENKTNVTA